MDKPPFLFITFCVVATASVVWTATEKSHLDSPVNFPHGVHEVHLRTGIIDLNAEHNRLPLPTPAARRLLAHINSAPTASPAWGPLAGAQLWLLTLGPSLHHHSTSSVHSPNHLIHLDPTLAKSKHDTSSTVHPNRNDDAISTSGRLPSDDTTAPPLRQYSELQSALLSRLHAAGCAVVSFLPPAAWLLVVGEVADLAPITADYPDIRLAPYAAPSHRMSPELAVAMGLLRRAGQAAAERLVAGGRLDEVVGEMVEGDETGWVLGALRLHAPAFRWLGGDGHHPSAAAAAAGGSGGGAPPKRLQIEVLFPRLEPEDRAYLAAAASRAAAAATGESSGNMMGGDEEPEVAAEGGKEYHPAAAAAADWSAPLAALSPAGCPPVLETEGGAGGGGEVLLVAVCPEALEETVKWLAAAPQVSWVAPRIVSRLHNLVASAIVQSGGNMTAANNPTSISSHPFWAAGLDGRNQTVGCGDSGLDWSSCFFFDRNVPLKPLIQVDSSGNQYISSTTHRKLRYYLALGGDLADGYGHGTHVSGTLVGSKTDVFDTTADPAIGTGQAPAAKIAFMDLSRDTSDGVWTPSDLSRSYFNLTYRVGVRVHSDSWGSDLTAYDSLASALDRFTWFNQDFVSVFAAGNYGAKTNANTTVTSPAVAKNCIAAGATLSMQYTGNVRPPWVDMYSMTVNMLSGSQVSFRTVKVVRASFGGELTAGVLDGTLMAVAQPEDACSTITNAGAVRGNLVLVLRGNCPFTDKVRNSAAAGAQGVIVYNNRQEGGYFPMQAPDGAPASSSAIPMGGVPQSTGKWLKAALDAGSVSVSFRRVNAPAEYPSFDDIATYSSFGPTTDGRIKPDIVAPGYLESAASNPSTSPDTTASHCDTKVLEGTSMATPVVAGSALLVRQYFMGGYYPEGRPNAAAAFTPSGVLVKAVLLGGADHMRGIVPNTGMPLEDAPSFRQGFGRLSLVRALPLPSSTLGWRLQVVDGAAAGAVLAQGETHRFCVRSTGGPLRITLAWYDWPGDPAAARALVNNLDLQVRAAGRAGVVEYGNGAGGPDAVNTVEQVWWDDLAAGDVAIAVSAPVVYSKAGKQPYALVVQGKFSGTLRAPSDNTSTATCAVQLAVIDNQLSTAQLTNSENITFYFNIQDSASPTNGFQCRLSLTANSSTTTAAPPNIPTPPTPSPPPSPRPRSPPPKTTRPPPPAAPASTTTSTDGWEDCSSPKTYTQVPDGRYSFQVRVRNEEVAAARSIVVDTQPPQTVLNSTLPAPTTPAGPIITASANATFTFTATDISTSINFTCKLSFTNGTASKLAPPYLRVLSGVVAGSVAGGGDGDAVAAALVQQFTACHSPLELGGMSYGDYKLEVVSYDEAHNSDPDPKPISWQIRYDPNVTYARLTSGPSGAVVASRTLEYGMVGFMGAADRNIPPLERRLGADGADSGSTALFEYCVLPLPAGSTVITASTGGANDSDGDGGGRRLIAGDGGSSGGGEKVARNWTLVTTPMLQVSVPSDGVFQLEVRPAGSTDPTTWAVAVVQVDTTPPIVAITRRPPDIQVDPWVTISFGDSGSEGDIRAYFCRWLGPAQQPGVLEAVDESTPPYSTCTEKSMQNVTEGYWLFQVKGRDAAGNVGTPTNVSFRTDLSPPSIINVTDLGAVNTTRVEWQWKVDDGPTGTGVVNTSCALRWSKLIDLPTVVPGTKDYPAGGPSAEFVFPCPDPAKYTVQAGIYVWSITATDGAGLRSSASYSLMVDFTPPVSTVTAASKPGRLLPSRVFISIASNDKPDGAASGVSQQLCLLEVTSAPPPSSPPPAPPPPLAPPLSPGSRFASVGISSPATNSGAGSGGGEAGSSDIGARERRRLIQQQQQRRRVLAASGSSVGPRLASGSGDNTVVLGGWHVCDATGWGTNVTYEGLSSGYYTFRVRAQDRAGNLGNPTAPYFFGVDASLPLEASEKQQTGSPDTPNRTRRIIIGVAVLVGVAILVASAVGIFIARRRHLRKRYGAPPPPVTGVPPHGIALQHLHPGPPPPSSVYSANGIHPGHHGAQGALAAVPMVVPAVPLGSGGGGSAMAGMSGGGGGAAMVGAPLVPTGAYYHVPVGGVVAGIPAPAPAAAEAEEQERIRRAIAASLEEENIRRATQASLQAVEREAAARTAAAAEQAQLEAAIAASLATAEGERRRQQPPPPPQPQPAELATPTAPPPPSASPPRPPGPPAESLI